MKPALLATKVKWLLLLTSDFNCFHCTNMTVTFKEALTTHVPLFRSCPTPRASFSSLGMSSVRGSPTMEWRCASWLLSRYITTFNPICLGDPFDLPEKETWIDRGLGHNNLPHLLHVLLLHSHLWIHPGGHFSWEIQDNCLHLHRLCARPPPQDPCCHSYPGSASSVSSNNSLHLTQFMWTGFGRINFFLKWKLGRKICPPIGTLIYAIWLWCDMQLYWLTIHLNNIRAIMILWCGPQWNLWSLAEKGVLLCCQAGSPPVRWYFGAVIAVAL